MAEIKNTFLKSKMNKDLDERLLPNGEYRDAQNIAISKSEDSNVGAAENIQGTQLVFNGNVGEIVGVDVLGGNRLLIIGQYADICRAPAGALQISFLNFSTGYQIRSVN